MSGELGEVGIAGGAARNRNRRGGPGDNRPRRVNAGGCPDGNDFPGEARRGAEGGAGGIPLEGGQPVFFSPEAMPLMLSSTPVR